MFVFSPDHRLIINKYEAGVSSQRWHIDDGRLILTRDASLTLDLAEAELGGAVVLAEADDSSETQDWLIERQYVG